MKSFTQTKEIFISALILIIAVIFGIFIIFQPFSFSQFQNSKISFENYNPNLKKIDTDNDGLSDDEENLIGTNPQIADTDKDGFLDGEEIASGHNPLIPAPADDLKYNPLAGQNLINKNYTQEFTRLIFGKLLNSYLEEKGLKNNSQLREQEQKELLDASIKNLFANLNNQNNNTEINNNEENNSLSDKEKNQLIMKQIVEENQFFIDQKIQEMEKELNDILNISINENELKIKQSNNANELENYKTIIKDIISKGFAIELKIYRLTKYYSTIENDQKKTIDKQLDSLIKQIKFLQIPSQYKNFHKTFLSYVIKQKIALSIILNNLESDPLKALFASKIIETSDQIMKNYIIKNNPEIFSN